MDQTLVETSSGILEGDLRDGVRSFLGVPFAEEPQGQLRFAPPKPFRSGVPRLAKEYGPVAPQLLLDAKLQPLGPESFNENCLNLNIWAPEAAAGCPVFFWIHGGGYALGAGSRSSYHGAYLAKRLGIVVVTINYRLGMLGFNSLPGMPDSSLNLGLQDQLLALNWVKENIGSFGGDSGRIVVAGESAGAGSALALWTSGKLAGLCAKVISFSAPIGVEYATAEVARQRGARFMEFAGAASFEELQSLPVSDLFEAQNRLLQEAGGGPMSLFWPVIDDEFVVDSQWVAPDNQPSELVLQYNQDEGRLFAPGVPGSPAWFQAAETMTKDTFINGVQQLQRSALDKGHQVEIRKYEWHPAGNVYGCCHAIEIPFTFGNLDQNARALPWLAGASLDELEQQRDEMMEWLGGIVLDR